MDVFGRVKNIIVELLIVDEQEVSMASTLVDLGADSLDIYEFAIMLQNEFDLLITDDEAGQMRTIGDVVQFIEEKIKDDR